MRYSAEAYIKPIPAISLWALEIVGNGRGALYYIADRPMSIELLELIQTQMAQKPMLRAEVGMRVRCANKASAE
jgi:hypothetical protein